MAATNTPEERPSGGAGRYRFVRELGARGVPTYAAICDAEGGAAQLRVVERLRRDGESVDEAADFVRDARRLEEVGEHPNVTRIRDVVILSDEVLVASDFLDGEPLGALLAAAQRPALEIVLRVLVDVLTGLGAIHNVRDAKKQALKLVHGEVTPDNVILGLDGSSRLVRLCRVRANGPRASRMAGYLAPEVLLADGPCDARADVYSVGVMLWEILSGTRLFADASPHTIIAALLAGKVAPPAVAPENAWAAGLADVALRAIALDPNGRFPNAAAMAGEIRAIAKTRLATTGRVAGFVKSSAGAKIAARREQLVSSQGSVMVPAPPERRPPAQSSPAIAPPITPPPAAAANPSTTTSSPAAPPARAPQKSAPVLARPKTAPTPTPAKLATPAPAPAPARTPPAAAVKSVPPGAEDRPTPAIPVPAFNPSTYVPPPSVDIPIDIASGDSHPPPASPPISVPPPRAPNPTRVGGFAAPAPAPNLTQGGGFAPPAPPPTGELPLPPVPPTPALAPAPAPTLASAPSPSAAPEPFTPPPRRRLGPIVIAILIPFIVLLAWAAIASVSPRRVTAIATIKRAVPASPAREPAPSAAQPPPTVATSTATANPAPAPAPASAQEAATAAPEPPEPAPSGVGAPAAPPNAPPAAAPAAPKITPRPKPTYDPLGI